MKCPDCGGEMVPCGGMTVREVCADRSPPFELESYDCPPCNKHWNMNGWVITDDYKKPEMKNAHN